ncbi:MAG: acyltransferase [Bacilli bacterium]|nr:acyltransferase [Bacilli bacterium]
MVLGVVFFHSFMMTFVDKGDSLQTFNPLMAMFPYLLGTFFFYSGYNYTPNNRTFGQNVARRAKQLLIPLVAAFLISAVLISAMELAFHHDDIARSLQDLGNSVLYSLMSEPLSLLIGFPKEGALVFELYLGLCLLWFLYALFICSVFFFLLVKFTNKSLPALISVVLGLLILAFCINQFIGTYLPYSVNAYPVILAIMLTGAYLRQSNFLEREITSKRDIALHAVNMVVAEGLVVGTCLFCYFQYGSTLVGAMAGGLLEPRLKGFDAFISFAFSIIGTYFIHTLCRLIIRIPVIGKCLQWLGNHSAIFYLFHPVFLELTAIVIFQKKIMWGIGQAFFYAAVVVVLLILTCLLMDLIVQKRKRKKPLAENVPTEVIENNEREQQ